MIRPEIFAGMVDEFSICGMVDCFDARYSGVQARRMFFDVLDEFRLRICGSRDEDGSGVGKALRHAPKKFVVIRIVAAANAVGLVMNVACRMFRAQHQPFDIGNVEMKDTSLSVINPHDRMVMV
jgi:hypothetical protein